MAKKRSESPSSASRAGGVNIGHGAHISVGGDLVGRDKISKVVVEQEMIALFAQLQGAIKADGALPQDAKEELLAKSKELEVELQKPNPDLSKLEQLKQFLSAHGKVIAASASAIFQYPAVQETIKTLAQKLIGG